jgi:alpha-tubulin suppressor-like RCC1 family protein
VTGGEETHAIAAGIAHTCAITPQGGVQCWGNNDFGQLGDGTNTASNVRVDVVGLQGGTSIVAGGNHTCVLSGSDVWCWGQNAQGQLGDGTTTDSNTPVKVLSNALEITAGLNYTCAVVDGEGVMCWGNNNRGQLADGTTTDHTTPTLATLVSDLSKVDAGGYEICGLSDTGLFRCSSNGSNHDLDGFTAVTGGSPQASLDVAVNRFGFLITVLTEDGLPVEFRNNQFKVVSDVGQALDVDSGMRHSCALLVTGSVSCWGGNYYGQLGRNDTVSDVNPQPVVNLAGAWQLAVGKNHACVLITSDTLGTDDIQCWGLNRDGQLGNGTNENSSVPVSVK